jgi:hypothetical protein
MACLTYRPTKRLYGVSIGDESLLTLPEFVCIYLDDILIFSETAWERAHSSKVLSCLRQHGLKA